MTLKKNLERYLDACFPILYINTFEEAKAVETIMSDDIAERRTVAIWSLANGYGEYSSKTHEWMIPVSKDEISDIHTILNTKLAFIDDLNRTILVIKDAHLLLEDEQVISALKEIAIRTNEAKKKNDKFYCCIVLISSVVKIPVELEKYITILESDYQNYDDICGIIKKFVSERGVRIFDPKLLEDMALSLKGLSEFEIINLLYLAVAEEKDGELSRKALTLIFEQKKQMIMKSGIMEMIPLKEKIDDIGGLENLKTWLRRKSKIFKNIKDAEDFGVDMPKGVLIAGIPGCGKSLCAKAAASLFGVPILRLDIGKLMGKYLGESEANLRKAINLAEAISPCVLWIDELEKAFAGMGSDGGHEVTTRLFGTFLTWMQEKNSTTFVVATANDITKLPPELLRKGRFDEIFYVGLPKAEERQKIFEIHISKRREDDLQDINIQELVSKTDGYSGADIEGVVKEGIEYAFTDDRKALTTKDILTAIQNSNSLSVIMKESLDKMKKEYEDRKLKNASR